MKKIMITLLGLALASTVYAADSENSKSNTVDQSTNPINGTKTTKKKWNSKKKNANGKSESSTTETTKEKTDGSTDKKTETDTKNQTN